MQSRIEVSCKVSVSILVLNSLCLVFPRSAVPQKYNKKKAMQVLGVLQSRQKFADGAKEGNKTARQWIAESAAMPATSR